MTRAAATPDLRETDCPELQKNRRPWTSLHNYLKGAGLNMAKIVDKARSAITGRFIPMEVALKQPSTTVVEKVKVGPIKHRKK